MRARFFTRKASRAGITTGIRLWEIVDSKVLFVSQAQEAMAIDARHKGMSCTRTTVRTTAERRLGARWPKHIPAQQRASASSTTFRAIRTGGSKNHASLV